MIRQIVFFMYLLPKKQLTPSGAQYWYKQILATCNHRFAYCSTMAIYICNSKTRKIESIISGHEGTISCIEWNQLNENLIASATVDNNFYLWDIEQEKALVRLAVTPFPIMLQWSRNDKNIILILHSSGIFFKISIKIKVR